MSKGPKPITSREVVAILKAAGFRRSRWIAFGMSPAMGRWAQGYKVEVAGKRAIRVWLEGSFSSQAEYEAIADRYAARVIEALADAGIKARAHEGEVIIGEDS